MFQVLRLDLVTAYFRERRRHGPHALDVPCCGHFRYALFDPEAPRSHKLIATVVHIQGTPDLVLHIVNLYFFRSALTPSWPYTCAWSSSARLSTSSPELSPEVPPELAMPQSSR